MFYEILATIYFVSIILTFVFCICVYNHEKESYIAWRDDMAYTYSLD